MSGQPVGGGIIGRRPARSHIGAIAILLALALGWAVLGPGQAPAGQPPLVILDQTSLDALRADFDRDSSKIRVVLLLSPT